MLLCSGSSTTAVYCAPIRADRMFASILPLKSAAPVLPLISVSDWPLQAATPASLAFSETPPPSIYDQCGEPLLPSFEMVPPS